MSKNRDYRFIAYTFLVGVIVGLTFASLHIALIIISAVLFILWGFALMYYMQGEK